MLDEIEELIRARVARENIVAPLEVRFGLVPTERVAPPNVVTDKSRLKALVRVAATCSDLDAFVAGLATGG